MTTVVLADCALCGEPVTSDPARGTVNFLAHRTCMLRNVLGGIGHLENHRYWCLERHDPDGGRSYYQSGIEVEDWIDRHGYPPRSD